MEDELIQNSFGTNIIQEIDEQNVHISDKQFKFDRVFDQHETQEIIFNETGKQGVQDIFEGFNSTIIAYGQTGSGKSFTMFGDCQSYVKQGIIPRTAKYLFDSIWECQQNIEYQVNCSMIEVYKEDVRDLLNGETGLKIKEDKLRGVYIENLISMPVVNEEEMYEVFNQGNQMRIVSET